MQERGTSCNAVIVISRSRDRAERSRGQRALVGCWNELIHHCLLHCSPPAMEPQGLLHWANSIRLTMATDPGRLVFKEQVQTHGFMFLDDYLDNIVSGAKAEYVPSFLLTPVFLTCCIVL